MDERHKTAWKVGKIVIKSSVELDGQQDGGNQSNERGEGCFLATRVAQMVEITEAECCVVVIVPGNQMVPIKPNPTKCRLIENTF